MASIHIVRFIALVLINSLVTVSAHAVTAGEPRAIAIVEALSTGNPAIYERAVRMNCTQAMIAKRTPQERAEMVKTIHADFGSLKIDTINADANGLRVLARGKDGQKLRLSFVFDGSPDALISSLGIEMGGDEGAEASILPALQINSKQSDEEIARTLDAWISQQVRSDEFAGVVLVARDGKPVFLRAYGFSDREKKIAANENTAYNIASIGKKFTQVAIAKLLQDGKLKLTTTIGEVIPDYPNTLARTATINQLVTMKGGVADFFGPGFNKIDKTKLNSNHAYYEHVSKLPPQFAPGARTEYCNGCYVVLGEIVERLSGMRFEEMVERTVFKPAGMSRTAYLNRASLPANTAIMYGRVRGPGAPYENTHDFHGATGSGAGGAYATAKDLLAFDNALRNSNLVNSEQTAWVLNGKPKSGRNDTPLGIAGGAPGTNAILESGGQWTVIVTANVDEPVPEKMGIEISRALAN